MPQQGNEKLFEVGTPKPEPQEKKVIRAEYLDSTSDDVIRLIDAGDHIVNILERIMTGQYTPTSTQERAINSWNEEVVKWEQP